MQLKLRVLATISPRFRGSASFPCPLQEGDLAVGDIWSAYPLRYSSASQGIIGSLTWISFCGLSILYSAIFGRRFIGGLCCMPKVIHSFAPADSNPTGQFSSILHDSLYASIAPSLSIYTMFRKCNMASSTNFESWKGAMCEAILMPLPLLCHTPPLTSLNLYLRVNTTTYVTYIKSGATIDDIYLTYINNWDHKQLLAPVHVNSIN